MVHRILREERHRTLIESIGNQLGAKRFRMVYCNRDLKLGPIRWIGFDMDYTLAIYNRDVLDALCHQLALDLLVAERGYPREILSLPCDPHFAIRGLVIDKRRGHLLKLDEHNFVGLGTHGQRPLTRDERHSYRRSPLRLSPRDFQHVDTLFELPEAWLHAALIEHFQVEASSDDALRLANDVRWVIDQIHARGPMKATIAADLNTYLERDPDLPEALHRLRAANKKLFLMTNSAWEYTSAVMSWLLDGVHPAYPSWRDYFDLVITDARKPRFFQQGSPFEELNDAGEVVREVEDDALCSGAIYAKGNMRALQRTCSAGGDEILYVGDHIYGDVLRSKRDSLWRTVMVIPEMEDELRAVEAHAQDLLTWNRIETELHDVQESISYEVFLLRRLEHLATSGALPVDFDAGSAIASLRELIDRLRLQKEELLAASLRHEKAMPGYFHPRWGSLFKLGNEHSRFGQLVQAHACLYTSRVSNLLAYDADHHFHAPRTFLPHERFL